MDPVRDQGIPIIAHDLMVLSGDVPATNND
jgi:hypothetical protein